MEKHRGYNYNVFIIVFFFIILSLLLHPTISSLLFPFLRDQKKHTFIAHIKSSTVIDPQTFWSFREFYYPGSLVVNTQGISSSPHFNVDSLANPFYFTSFRSKYITSDEFLVATNSVEQIVTISDSVILKKNNQILTKDADGSYTLFFTKPISEMIKANAFFDHREKHKELLKNKYWLVITNIR